MTFHILGSTLFDLRTNFSLHMPSLLQCWQNAGTIDLHYRKNPRHMQDGVACV